MINNIKAHTLLLIITLVLFLSLTQVTWADQTTTPFTHQQASGELLNSLDKLDKTSSGTIDNPAQQAQSVANELQSMSNTIQANHQALTGSGASQTIANVSLLGKLTALVSEIELQSKKLAELVTNKAANASDSPQLNTIINNLNEQRQSLVNFFAPSTSVEPVMTMAAAPTMMPSVQPSSKEKSLPVFTTH